MAFEDAGVKLLEKGRTIGEILGLPIRERIAKAKYVPEDQIETINSLTNEILALAEEEVAMEVG